MTPLPRLRMRRLAIGALLPLVGAGPLGAQDARTAADAAHDAHAAPAVRLLAATCANCHGPQGDSPGAMPSIAGLPREHLVERLRMLRAGAADATLMHQLAKAYSDDEIERLAAHFARQPRGRRTAP
jgi:sulfide dehydrogenase cytochrome subunit